MKLRRNFPPAPTLISVAAIALAALSGACTFTPPSAANPPAATAVSGTAAGGTAEPVNAAATPEDMPLPTLPPGRTPRQIETPVTTVVTTTREPVKTGQLPSLVFQWRGGIAGRNDLWTIYASGLIRNNKDQQFEVPPETVSALMQQLDTLGFYDLNDRYEAACNDCFEYTIYAYRPEGRKVIYAIDNGALPPELMQAVQAIQDVVAPTK